MKCFYHDIELAVPDSVYEPADDSFLFADLIERQDIFHKCVLDVGCGSGLLSIVSAKKQAYVTAVDINPTAVETTRQNAGKNHVLLTAIASDLFAHVTGTFDCILFNAPYLPVTSDDHDPRWAGGKTGRAVIERFVEHASNFLAKNSVVFVLISSLTGEEDVKALFEAHGFAVHAVRRTKVPWEELIILECRKNKAF